MMSQEKVATLRNSISSVQQEIASAPSVEKTINWSYYSSIISNPAVVEKLRQSYAKVVRDEDAATKADIRSKFFGAEYVKEVCYCNYILTCQARKCRNR